VGCGREDRGPALFQLLADRYGDGKPERRVFVYAAGGYYYPGKDDAALKDEMRSCLARGYTVVKMKIGGASRDEDRRRYGGMRPDRGWLQFDCALSYGLVEYLRTLGLGGNESYPDLFRPWLAV
jgi:L-alanine-DL-glutamate epimerase-like enolase superfamily enzyme